MPAPEGELEQGRRCAVCGWASRKRARFCERCGARLRTGRAGRFTPTRLQDSERRT